MSSLTPEGRKWSLPHSYFREIPGSALSLEQSRVVRDGALHGEATHGANTELPQIPEPSVATMDSIAETLDLDTRVETMFTHTPLKAGRWVDTTCGEGRIVTRLITEEEDRIEEPLPVSQQKEEQAEMKRSASGTSSELRVDLGLSYGHLQEIMADSMILADAEPSMDKMVLATLERFENATKPEYPGGIEEMERYIHDNIKQPRGTKKSGTVTVGFTVNKKGEVTNVEVAKSLGRAFDAEAVRVITSMPQWEPSRLRDRSVKSKLQVRVRFYGTPRKRVEKEGRQ